MIQTPQTVEYVEQLAARTMKLMEVDTVVFINIKEFNLYFKSKGSDSRLRKSRRYGITRKMRGVTAVFIDIRNHSSVKSLNDTVVHELYHVKDWGADHGARFDRKVDMYLEMLFDSGVDKNGSLIKYKGEKY